MAFLVVWDGFEPIRAGLPATCLGVGGGIRTPKFTAKGRGLQPREHTRLLNSDEDQYNIK